MQYESFVSMELCPVIIYRLSLIVKECRDARGYKLIIGVRLSHSNIIISLTVRPHQLTAQQGVLACVLYKYKYITQCGSRVCWAEVQEQF